MMYWRLKIDRRGFRDRSFAFKTAADAIKFLEADWYTDERDPDTRVTLVRNGTVRPAPLPPLDLPPPNRDASVWA